MSIATPSISRRATGIADTEPFRLLLGYLETIEHYRHRPDADVLDFSLGNPHQMPSPAYVAALQEALVPQHEGWFAYQMYQPLAQQAAAASLQRHTGLPFAPDDMLLTTGGFAALSIGMKLVADPGDEVIYSLPPWFLYEGLAVEAGLNPVKVAIDRETFLPDIAAIAAAITPRTRLVIINSPNNPTGRIYPAETLTQLADVLEDASQRNGRRIFLLSDEAYNRIIFRGHHFVPPAAFYPHTLVAYSYGKTLLAPGQRVGYLALPPALPERDALRQAALGVQVTCGYAFPNAILQYALPTLEQQIIDMAQMERRRDLMVDALSDMGYEVRRPEGAFYLFPHAPGGDDLAFTQRLLDRDILAMPGTLFETPGYFRLSLTANDATCERALPGFAAAIGSVATA